MKNFDIPEHIIPEIQEIIEILRARLKEHPDEVIATLESVVSGELELVETVTDEEAERFRKICEAVLETGLPESLQSTLRKVVLGNTSGKPSGKAKLPLANEQLTPQEVLMLMSYFFYEDFHYPQPATGKYDISNDPFEKMKWAYRLQLNQLEVAERGSGMEKYFKEQNLSGLARVAPLGSSVATITCAGDLLAVDALLTGNTDRLFNDIADFYSSGVDIVSANLESTVYAGGQPGRKINQGKPAQMNTTEDMFKKFCSEAGINFFSTATNHSMDWGEIGVEATIDVINKYNVDYAGTAKDQTGQSKVVIREINGIKIALLSFTMDLNDYATPPTKPYLANEVRFNDVPATARDYSLIQSQVNTAKELGADWIIAYCHWGWEFEMYPHSSIRDAAREIIDLGVDTILGNHAHVSQPSEIINGKLVIYSFGDFVSFHPSSRNSKLSYIVKFEVYKSGSGSSAEIGVSGLKAMPVYIVNQHLGGGGYNCRIVPFSDVLGNRDGYGLTDIEKSQLNHLRDNVWGAILSPLSSLNPLLTKS